MKVGLIDVDGHHYPNLALMKLSAWHKSQGDTVEWWWGWGGQYDRVYMSKVFDDTYTPDIPEPVNAAEIIKGGNGYGLDNKLPDEIEHISARNTKLEDTVRSQRNGLQELREALTRVTAERDAAEGEVKHLKAVLRKKRIMTIPPRYPWGRPEWNE